MTAYLMEWGSMLLRWLHVITGIAWIGSSFFFMHLDASLRAASGIPAGKGGAAWQVHGGGFYEMRKYLVAPERMPEELTWHKWQSYWTWISGFSLLCWVYYGQSQLYLIDPAIRDLSPLAAAAIGIGAIACGWLIYDALCRSPLARHEALLAGLGLALIIAASFGFTRVFSGRGALIHTGALMATLMTANVFFVIIPNQRKVVADLVAGRSPDPALGKQAKQRSVHNNYLTLPVLFFMLSNHYPVTYANPAAIPPLVGLVVIAGAVIRHFYNIHHTDKAKAPWWAWAVATVALWTAFWVAMSSSPAGREVLGLPPTEPMTFSSAATDPPTHVVDIIRGRCSMCHSPEPFWEGVGIAPKGVLLDTPHSIARFADAIRVEAVMTHAMPPNNVTEMTDGERAAVAAWLKDRQAQNAQAQAPRAWAGP